MRMKDNKRMGPMAVQGQILRDLMTRHGIVYHLICAATASLPDRQGHAVSESTLFRFINFGVQIRPKTLQDIARGISAISDWRKAENRPGIPQEEIDLILKPTSAPLEAQA